MQFAHILCCPPSLAFCGYGLEPAKIARMEGQADIPEAVPENVTDNGPQCKMRFLLEHTVVMLSVRRLFVSS